MQKNSLEKFYDSFHSQIKIQKKIISKYNFTYILSIRIIEKYLNSTFQNNPKINILDYGCGVGTLDFYFANKGFSVTGVDISPAAVKVANLSAKSLGLQKKLKFYSSKLLTTRLKRKKYDVILCLEVIEHVVNDFKLINQLIKNLNKNGILIISTPSINSPLYRLGLADAFDEKVGHLRRYDAEKLKHRLDIFSHVNNVEVLRTEGLLRNSLFLFYPLNGLIRFIKGPLSLFVTYIDNMLLKIFGESNIYVVARKK